MSRNRRVQPFSRTDGRLHDLARLYDAGIPSSMQGYRRGVCLSVIVSCYPRVPGPTQPLGDNSAICRSLASNPMAHRRRPANSGRTVPRPNLPLIR